MFKQWSAQWRQYPFSLLTIAHALLLLLPLVIIGGRSGMDICFTLMGFCFLADCIRHHRWQSFRPAWVKLALIIWLYLFIRSLFVQDVANSIDRGLLFGRFILGALAIEWVMRARQQAAKQFFQLLAAVVVFIIVDTFIQYFVGQDILGHLPNLQGRLTGPFSDVRVGSVLMMIAFPLACWALTNQTFKAHPMLNRILGLVIVLAFIGAVFVSGERMAFIMTSFGLLIAILLLPKLKKLGLVLAVLVVVFFSILSVLNPKILERQFDSSKEMIMRIQDSTYGQIWRNAIKTGMQQPLVGVGPRQFREVCPSLPLLEIHGYPYREQCNLHTHQIYLEWFAETGLIGLGLFIALVGLWFRQFAMAIKRNPDDSILIGIFVFMIVFLWPLKSSASFFTNVVALPFWMMLGWGMALMKKPAVE